MLRHRRKQEARGNPVRTMIPDVIAILDDAIAHEDVGTDGVNDGRTQTALAKGRVCQHTNILKGCLLGRTCHDDQLLVHKAANDNSVAQLHVTHVNIIRTHCPRNVCRALASRRVNGRRTSGAHGWTGGRSGGYRYASWRVLCVKVQ